MMRQGCSQKWSGGQWECGPRDAATLKKLVDRLAHWEVTFYCTDH